MCSTARDSAQTQRNEATKSEASGHLQEHNTAVPHFNKTSAFQREP